MQYVFSASGVWCQLSSCLGMQKDPVYVTCVHLCKLIVSSAIAGLVINLIVATSKWHKILMRARKKELGDWHETEMKIEDQNVGTTL